MAVLRNSQETNIAVNSTTAQVQQSAAPQASPNFANAVQAQPGIDSKDRILMSFLKDAKGVADAGRDAERVKAYQDGQAAAATGATIDTLNQNPLTASWGSAGYHDTSGALAMASRDADTAANLVHDRELDPTVYGQQLAASRSKVLPAIDNMTPQQRGAAIGQLAVGDKAAIVRQGVEHAKFIVEQKGQAVAAGAQVQFGNLDATKADAVAYSAQTDAAYQFAYGSIVQDPGIPDKAKQDLLYQTATAALAGDHQQLYGQMANVQVDLPGGRKGSMLSMLPISDQVKLATQLRESQGRTDIYTKGDWINSYAQMQAQLDDPTVAFPTAAEFSAKVAEGGSLMAPKARVAAMETYYNAAQKRMGTAQAVTSLLAGDMQGISNAGKTPAEAVDAYVTQMQVGKAPLPAQVASLVNLGIHGQPAALSKVGSMLKPAFAQMATGQPMDPNTAGMLQAAFGALDKSEQSGNSNVYSTVLSGFDEGDRARVLDFRNGLRKGLPAQVASDQAVQRQQQFASMSPEQRKALADTNAADDIALAAEVTPRGFFGSLIGGVKSIVSGNAAAMQAIRPRQNFWGDSDVRVGEATAQSKLALMEELRNVDPNLSTSDRKTAALAAVNARTILTDEGPLIVPQHTNVQAFFGSPNAANDRIAKGIDALVPPVKDGHNGYGILNGQLVVYQYHNDERVGTKVLDPKAVGAKVDELFAEQTERAKSLIGPGIRKSFGNGIVQFNGETTTGVDPSTALAIRVNLVDHEGVRDTPYRDKSNDFIKRDQDVMTVGVGVSSTNAHYPKPGPDGKVSKADISRSFMMASNDAMRDASNALQRHGIDSKPMLLLSSELAYQSGPGFATHPAGKAMLEAVQRKDKVAATTALHQTPAYKMAHDSRQKFYDYQLQHAF